MSLYGRKLKIDNVFCGMVIRTGTNGVYQAVFEREFASLEAIEGINWASPTIKGNCVLPTGYGFDVTDISYSFSTDSYTVTLKTAKQYLGDVVDMQATLEEMQKQLDEKDSAIAELEKVNLDQKEELESKEKALESLQTRLTKDVITDDAVTE